MDKTTTQSIGGLKSFTNNCNFTASLLSRTNMRLYEYNNQTNNTITLTFPMERTIALRASSGTSIILNLPTITANERGMTFTFIKALGGQVGNSICENDKLDLALALLHKAKEKNVQVHLPVDVIAADAFKNDAHTQIVDVREIPDGWQGLDAGPRSLENFKSVIMNSKTILWNGPLGVFEMENFAKGTLTLGEYIAESTANGAFSLVGGGDSVAAVKQFGLEGRMSYVSTGGGAMLEMLEGRTLPGIQAILD